MPDKACSDTYSDFSPLCDFNQTSKLKSQLDFESLTLWGQSVCVASLPKGIFGVH